MNVSLDEIPIGFLEDLFDLMDAYGIKEIAWDIDLFDCPKKGLFAEGRKVSGLVFKRGDDIINGEQEEQEEQGEQEPESVFAMFTAGQKVLVRDYDNDDWHLHTFVEMNKDKGSASLYPFRTMSEDNIHFVWRQCIPYKGNEYTLVEQEEKEKKNSRLEPFQRVLVRQSEEDHWEPNIFKCFDRDASSYKYGTLEGEFWIYCIPYEGNEELLYGTSEDN